MSRRGDEHAAAEHAACDRLPPRLQPRLVARVDVMTHPHQSSEQSEGRSSCAKEGLVTTTPAGLLQSQLQNHRVAARHVQRVGDVPRQDHSVWRERRALLARHGRAATPVGGPLQRIVDDEHPREEAVLAAHRGGALTGVRMRLTEHTLSLMPSHRLCLHGRRCAGFRVHTIQPPRVFLAWRRLEFLWLKQWMECPREEQRHSPCSGGGTADSEDG